MVDFKHGSLRKREYLIQEYLKLNYGIGAVSMFMILNPQEIELVFMHLHEVERNISNGPFKTFLRKNKGHEFLKI